MRAATVQYADIIVITNNNQINVCNQRVNRCPIFKVCPAKGVIGDYKKGEADKEKQAKQQK